MADRRRQPGAALAASLALILAAPLAAQAEDPCLASLAAATSLGDGSGIGGTGLSEGSGSGIGGTGLSEEGPIYVFGTVTAFGSVCVNGLRVVFEPDVPVKIGTTTASAADLALGQVVWIEATVRAGRLEANQIAVIHAVVGRITARDPDGSRIQVLGRHIDVPADARVEGTRSQLLAPGRTVAISGHWIGADRVEASRITAAEVGRSAVGPRLSDLLSRVVPGARLAIEGYARAANVGDLRVDGLRVEVPADLRPEREVDAGDRVRAFGRLTEERALRVSPSRPPERPQRPERPPRIERPERIERPQRIDRLESAPRVDVLR